MPFQSRRAPLELAADIRAALETISRSRSEPVHRVTRAAMLLAYASGATISSIARSLGADRQKVGRCIDKALRLGALAALEDMPRSGRPAQISSEARKWVVSLACRKPKDLGYAEESWTMKLLALHARQHCEGANHPSLSKLAPATVWKILSRQENRPRKNSYRLERRGSTGR